MKILQVAIDSRYVSKTCKEKPKSVKISVFLAYVYLESYIYIYMYILCATSVYHHSMTVAK